MKPQAWIGWPSTPLRRGPDRPALDLQGTILNVAPVSTKYLSFVKATVRKMRPAFAGKCKAVAVACAEFAAELVRFRRHFSFPTRNMVKCTSMLCCHRNCELAHEIARVLEIIEVGARRRMTFGMGVAVPFVIISTSRSWASTALSRGGCDCGVVAALGVSQGIRGSNHGNGCLVVSSTYSTASRMVGGRRIRNIERKKSLSGGGARGRCCLSFPVRMLGLRHCISMGSRSNSK
jgi:hypothetical protein